MAIDVTHVDGRDAGSVMLYALSTCGWCKKTKRLLGDLGVAYDYVDVDLLEREDKREIEREVARWNSRGSFPTIVINQEKAIAGFKEDPIREALGS